MPTTVRFAHRTNNLHRPVCIHPATTTTTVDSAGAAFAAATTAASMLGEQGRSK